MPGRLVLCPTPIGNLADITLRALAELGAADLILAEDTRRTRVLLDHHGITRPLRSYHDHNEAARLPEIRRRLAAGELLVLVSDAGSPGLADPGFTLVREALAAGAEVTALPGPTALLPALCLSGLPMHRFAFLGFVPRTAVARAHALGEALALPLTCVWYEVPHRLCATLATLVDLGFGARPAAVARELSKVHEEVGRGPVEALWHRFREDAPRGEIVLCIGAAEAEAAPDWAAALAGVRAAQRAGRSLSQAVAQVATARGLPRRNLYAAALREGEEAAAPSPGGSKATNVRGT